MHGEGDGAAATRVTTQTAKVLRAPESPFMTHALLDDWTKPRSTRASIEEGEHLGLLALQGRAGGAARSGSPEQGIDFWQPCGGRQRVHLLLVHLLLVHLLLVSRWQFPRVEICCYTQSEETITCG